MRSQETYKDWVCAMLIPVRADAATPSATQLCRRVEQRCPYFHPTLKDQYAGEPVFFCADPDIEQGGWMDGRCTVLPRKLIKCLL